MATEEELAEDRFRLALEAMPDLVAIQRAVRDESGRTIDFVFEFVNYPDLPVGDMARRELIGESLLDVLPALGRSPVFEMMVQVADTGIPGAVEDTPVSVQASGEDEPRYATVQIAPFGDGVIAVVRDVSERQRHLRRIEQAHDELAAAQQLAHIGVWRVDLATAQLTLSDEAARIVGRSSGGVIPWEPGMLLDLVDPDDRQRVTELIGSAQDGSFLTETDLQTAEGDRRVSLVGQVVTGESSAIVWGTVQDVTEQRRQERALREARDHLEQERSTVMQLQLAILPTLPGDGVEVGAVYRPAGEASLVGGDWYDAFEAGSDRFFLAIGDVAGHGLPAAALMSQLRNALRGIAFAGHAPDEILTALNRLIFETGEDEVATSIVGCFDREKAELHWASAGHPPPLVVPRVGPARFLDGSSSALLGFRPGTVFSLNATAFEPGATLLFYSDGLVERRDENLDVGLARLAAHANDLADPTAQQLCDHLVEVLVSPADARDDVCVLAFRVP